MPPNLKLVANLEPVPSGQNAALQLSLNPALKPTPKLPQTATRHLLLHPLAAITADTRPGRLRTKPKQPGYALLAAVAGIHLAGIAWLLSAAGTAAAIPPSKTELNTISVSLLSAAVAKPIAAPITKTVAKTVAKAVKTEPVKTAMAKTEMVKTDVAKPEIAKTEVAKTEIVTTSAEASDVNADSALQAAAPAATALAETSIEPPRFAAAYLHNPAPEYPQLSRRMGEQGRVLLRVLVSSNGVADQVQIETSSGSSKLDAAALKAVEKWNFVPAKRSNQPVSAYVLVPVKFSLNS